ncbi:FAD binding domain-containing protein [Pseudonocardia endophytica]|uniref:Carbon-monoxide dehydrogenase medium subunit n=1 Tax=Pseudonocardia endophytica TaxID=401976 RepID=A0A4R1I0B5_PSEEN|nr:FAD binding domain-containing protein [Pseudonocardia endophytica]TCK27293.1 carbon-monoxide dehydrogenase medium subunit [Pseudonocardia endophytica]
MKAAPFEYVLAGSVEEVVTTLRGADGDGKILAGGQSLVPVLALRMARPSVLVDVNRVPGMVSVEVDGDAVEVGALVRHAHLAAQDEHPLLAEAADWIGHTAIRTRGTLGGSLAHADPSAELPAVAVALDATVTVAGPDGVRTVTAADLFDGPLMTSLADDEMITGARFPTPRRWGFAELARRHGDFALVTAVVARMTDGWRVVLGGVSGVPQRIRAAERVLDDGGSSADAADAVADGVTPTSDLHGSAEFRRAMAVEMVRRALKHSEERA